MLTHVTFTGWDRHTDLAELEEFLQACPQDSVEIAVLHSTSRVDEDRYPDVGKGAAILRTAKAAGQRSAVHLCGRVARDILSNVTSVGDGTRTATTLAAGQLLRLADRVQVNVDESFWAPGREPHDHSGPEGHARYAYFYRRGDEHFEAGLLTEAQFNARHPRSK